MNTFCFVGQIDSLPELKEVSPGLKQATLTLKIIRPFKDCDGMYRYDYIPIEVWRGLAETLCKAGKLDGWISVRGRVKSSEYSVKGKSVTSFSFIAEHIGFIQ